MRQLVKTIIMVNHVLALNSLTTSRHQTKVATLSAARQVENQECTCVTRKLWLNYICASKKTHVFCFKHWVESCLSLSLSWRFTSKSENYISEFRFSDHVVKKIHLRYQGVNFNIHTAVCFNIFSNLIYIHNFQAYYMLSWKKCMFYSSTCYVTKNAQK